MVSRPDDVRGHEMATAQTCPEPIDLLQKSVSSGHVEILLKGSLSGIVEAYLQFATEGSLAPEHLALICRNNALV